MTGHEIGWQRPPFDLTDVELDDLERLTRDPESWPAEHRQSLPTIRALVLDWQRQRATSPGLSTDTIQRRIGAHV
jgi:hypothetical protein